ncbi:N-formylglutamate amidohydrolase [Rhizobium sp. YIM 134829]|uniref:N-formylglutamate amidohydrolase n=1 Tax=Rhizobium sp. YIM 134829 TaxID=3390453 RepID=UPI0039787C63
MGALLTTGDGAAVAEERPEAKGPVILVCEHASATLPERIGTLGLTEAALSSHIAWDPGALAVCRLLSEALDATLVFQRFSRLVYDCNRPPEAVSAMPPVSEVFEIPGNQGLTPKERLARTEALYFPFRDHLARLVAARKADGRAPVLVTVHSFTPIYFGKPREVELGILHDSDSRLADAMLAAGEGEAGVVIRRNAPYGPADGVTHTLIEHGVKAGIANVMIEIRNDLIAEESGQRVMAALLARLLGSGLAALANENNKDPGSGMSADGARR